jgi:glycosyltransferase involved in cell wall biosynthesis
MLNFHQMISLAAQAVGDRPVVAAAYPIPKVICEGLATERMISGYVADTHPTPNSRESFIAGWWVDRREGVWFIRNSGAKTMILLSASPETELCGRMLLEARLKGIRRILYVGPDGSIVGQIDVVTALLDRLNAAPLSNPIHRSGYDELFADIYAHLGDRFRLSSSAFAPDRVLIMSGNLQAGGAERQATYTATGLARRFPGKIFFGLSRSGGSQDFYKAMLDAAGVMTCVAPEQSEEFNSPEIVDIRNRLASRYSSLGGLDIFSMIFHHAMMIRDIRPRLVHTFQDWSNVFGGVAADLVGVPRLVLGGRSVAPDNFAIFQPYMASAYQALLERRALVFLNNSEAGAQDYARWLGLARSSFRVIHNGFEFPEIPASSRSSLRREVGIPEDAIVVGSIIGFREEKRPQLWLDMAVALHRAHPQVRFLVFGEGQMLDSSRAFVQSNRLADVIKLPGLTNDAWCALSAMDIFVLTSRLEGLPNVMVEAQSVGLPVVCTGGGGVSETFVEGETGFTAPSATPEALAETVGRLINDPGLLSRMRANARGHARETFGIERMISRTIEAYRATPEHKSEVATPPDWCGAGSPTEIRLGAILKEGKNRFVAKLPSGLDLNTWEFWEEDHKLARRDGGARAIRTLRLGEFHLDGQHAFFSTPDGTDPRFDGRTYRLRLKNADRDYDDVVVGANSIAPELGHCYVASLGLGEGSARFALWEDCKRLGPGGCLHDDIRAQGGGRYSVWKDSLYFSSSDNTDPRTNQRSYVLRRAKIAPPAPSLPIMPNGSLESIMRRLVRNAAPRDDFVPGRVVHVGGSLGPGGAERQLYYTLAGLSKESVESVQLLCYFLGATADRHDFYLSAFEVAGIPVRTIRRQVGMNDPASMPTTLRGLREALPRGLAQDIADLFWEFVEIRPEVVHAWLDGNNVRAGLAAALAGVPRIIVAGRNVNPSHFELYESYMEAAYKALLDLPQVTMINNSYAGRDDYARWLGLPPNRIPVVYNGCNFPFGPLHKTRMAARAAYGIPPDSILVGTVSRFSKEKHPRLFVELARTLLEEHPDLYFIYFGTGSMRGEIQSQIDSYGLSAKVKLPGITDDVWTDLAAMDVFVLTSRMEGLPNVLIEAQGAGLPVVSTTVGGAPETFIEGKTGFGIPVLTAEAMAEPVSRLIRDPVLRRKMSEDASSFVRERFSIKRMISRTIEIYWGASNLFSDADSGAAMMSRYVRPFKRGSELSEEENSNSSSQCEKA